MPRYTYHNVYSPEQRDGALDDAFEQALAAARGARPDPTGHLVGGRQLADGPVREREDPSRSETIVSSYLDGEADTVEAAVRAARGAAPEWSSLEPAARAAVLAPIEAQMNERAMELAAILSLETGKSRTEALAEVEEVVELLHIYSAAAQDEATFRLPLTPHPNSLRVASFIRPYGVFGVIAPFNYPIALSFNMSMAALLAGNTVVLKPSHLAPRSASAIAEVMAELELPDGAFNMVMGADGAGKALVGADIDGIAFTGSVDVGRSILRQLQDPYPRPVIAEMGGKNAALVMSSGDLETAASAVATSAFGLSGQKCSACSRVLVAADVHDEFLELLEAATLRIDVGDPANRDSFAGPVVDGAAMSRFERAAELARSEGRIAVGGDRFDDSGYFAAPTIAADLPLGHSLSRQELFLPFLTVTRVAGFDEALGEANAVPVGLTAGIFSTDQTEIDRFLAEAEVGCTLVNHSSGATTGLWPGVQTFGGWKASGTTGSHGFSGWYLQRFGRQQCQTIEPVA